MSLNHVKDCVDVSISCLKYVPVNFDFFEEIQSTDPLESPQEVWFMANGSILRKASLKQKSARLFKMYLYRVKYYVDVSRTCAKYIPVVSDFSEEI